MTAEAVGTLPAPGPNSMILSNASLVEEHGVVGAGDAGQRVRPRDEGRVHAHVHAPVDELGDAEQLGDEAEPRAVGDVGGR